MKKVTNPDNQFDLDKEVIANLSEEQLQEVEGGQAESGLSCLFVGGDSCTGKTKVDGGDSE